MVALSENPVEIEMSNTPGVGDEAAGGADGAKGGAAGAGDIRSYMEKVQNIKVTQYSQADLEKFLGDVLDDAHLKSFAPEDLADQSDEMKSLRTAIEARKIESRTPLDSKFRREHAPGTAGYDEYNKLKGAAKQEFKVKWAQKMFDKKYQEKTFKKGITQTDRQKSKMLTFGALVQEYGGWEWDAAVEGAKRTAAKCAKLGGKWCKRDGFSELLLYRKIDEEEEEEFKKTWSEMSRMSTGDTSGSAPVQQSTPAPSKTRTNTEGNGDKQKKSKEEEGEEPAAAEAATGGAAGGKRKRAAAEAGDSGKKVRTGDADPPATEKNKSKTTEAVKLKPLYMRSVHSAELLIKQIEESAHYTWARGSVLEELKESLKTVIEGKTECINEFLVTSDLKTFTANYSSAQLESEFDVFVAKKPLVESLQSKQKEIADMHRVKRKASK